MRPLELEMQAFGPYAGTQKLDMKALGECGIYAITGETGAGKTTIFDAIVYALYGTGSGEDRKDPRTLRALAADPSLETKVSLRFVSGGKTYTIERKPEQYLMGRRSGAAVKKPASQILTMPDGTVYTRASEIDGSRDHPGLVERDILGVTKDQFCQIVMIAQGEFRRLLRADTRERTVILRRIFRTERFDALSRQMEKVCKEQYASWQSALEGAAYALRRLIAPDAAFDAPLRALQKTEPRALFLESALQLADQIARADADEDRLAKQALEEAEQARDATRIDLERARERSRMQKTLEALTDGLTQARSRLQASEGRLEDLQKHRPEIDTLGREIVERTGQLERYDALEALEEKRRVAAQGFASVQDDVRRDEERLSGLVAAQDALLREAEEKKDAADRCLSIASLLSEARERAGHLQNLEARCKARNRLRAERDLAAEAARRAVREAETQRAALSALEAEAEALGNAELAVSKLQERLRALDDDTQRLLSLSALMDRYETAAKAHAHSCEVLAGLKSDWQAENARATDLRSRYLSGIAGLWARTLTEGTPCPVCGSTHHPCKAEIVGEPVTEEAANVQEARADAAKEAANAQAAEVSQRAATCEALRRQLSEAFEAAPEETWGTAVRDGLRQNERERPALQRDCEEAQDRRLRAQALRDQSIPKARASCDASAKAERDATVHLRTLEADLATASREVDLAAQGVLPEDWTALDLSDALASSSATQVRLNADLEAARRDRERLADIEREQKERIEAIEQLRRDIQTSRERMTALREQLDAHVREVEALKSALPFAERRECERDIERMKAQKAEFEAQIDAAQKEVNALQVAVASTEGEIRSLTKQLEGRQAPDLERAEEAFRQRQTAYEGAVKREKAVHVRKTSNDESRGELSEQAGRAGALEREYATMKDVLDTVKGNVTDSSKIPLETFAQTAYFDHILRFANRRLIHMSRHQYDLARQNVRDGGKAAKTGLELDVIDHANGQRRAVSTLSGGESFLASLAFALGMSDAIQAGATAAVQLDTMFVDEGFGSLSENFLNLVMDELDDTANAGRRLIGIISHVDDVKDGIGRRIEVEKSLNGVSTARIV